MPRIRPLLYALLALTMAVPVVQAGLVWRPGEGWSDESGSDVSASSSRDQLELAHKLEAQGQRDDALKAYKNLLRRWPLSFFAPEAQFRMGKIMEDEADFYNAFQAFQKMVQKYPSSNYFEEALGEQYRIANLYLAGEPQRIWKIPVGPSMDKTVEMYERIIKNAPFGTYAAECQFKIGLARENQRKYTDAVDAYQKVIDNYPTSSVAANAQYQIGYAWMTSSMNGDYDQGAAKRAIDAFEDYIVRYPTSDKAPQAQENIQKLGQKETQGAYNIARFYDTAHPPELRAAFIYYNEVVREDPNSPQAQLAKKRIQELRPIVEKMPGGIGPDGTPGAAQTVASGPQAPLPSSANPADSGSTNTPSSTVPDSSSTVPAANSTPDGSMPESSPAPTDASTTNNGPMENSSPGATAASSSSATNDGSSPAAPAKAPPDKTPLPQ